MFKIEENRFLESLENDEIGEAWQYKMRVNYADIEKNDKYLENYNLSIKDSIVKEISFKDAKSVIEKYEWLREEERWVKLCLRRMFV